MLAGKLAANEPLFMKTVRMSQHPNGCCCLFIKAVHSASLQPASDSKSMILLPRSVKTNAATCSQNKKLSNGFLILKVTDSAAAVTTWNIKLVTRDSLLK